MKETSFMETYLVWKSLLSFWGDPQSIYRLVNQQFNQYYVACLLIKTCAWTHMSDFEIFQSMIERVVMQFHSPTPIDPICTLFSTGQVYFQENEWPSMKLRNDHSNKIPLKNTFWPILDELNTYWYSLRVSLSCTLTMSTHFLFIANKCFRQRHPEVFREIQKILVGP